MAALDRPRRHASRGGGVTEPRGAADVRVRRHTTGDGAEIWIVMDLKVNASLQPIETTWLEAAAQIFAARAEVASVSVVNRSAAAHPGQTVHETEQVEASRPALPVCYFGGHVADLLGLDRGHDQRICTIATLQQWADAATLKGLIHMWHLVDAGGPGLVQPLQLFRDPGDASLIDASEVEPRSARALSIGIDAAWLLGGESGAQVFAFEMLKELARRPQIARLVMLSDSGDVPRMLASVEKISGTSWQDLVTPAFSRLDIIHRPYQPGIDVDYHRYYAAGNCVAVTVLDFIAYDNPWYHESERSWRQYRQAFDENVCLSDCVFAISDHIGSRIERQFAHQLTGPVRRVLLGTDHLSATAELHAGAVSPGIAALEPQSFLLVLGNDFAHKNRDFAVKVFVDMRERGYRGRLVLAGFHLDLGSSYAFELHGAEKHLDRIVRIGSVSPADKTWLMQRAAAVMYPTSSEGFGLVPFEAAAVGTPTAFVRFGPLRETLPDAAASDGWRVRSFADHVFALIADRARHVAQVRAAGARLTWSAHVDAVIEGYDALMSNGTPWRSRGRQLPGTVRKVQQAVASLKDRVTGKVNRVLGVHRGKGVRSCR